MNRQEALSLLFEYQEFSLPPEGVRANPTLEILNTIRDRFLVYGNEAKAMRWLGFAQGVLFAGGWFGLDALKTHSKNKTMLGSADKALQDPEFAAAVDVQIEIDQLKVKLEDAARLAYNQAKEILTLRKEKADWQRTATVGTR